MKVSTDYKSRFRILKGGKISLVLSALMASSIINVANAAVIDVASGTTRVSHTLTEDSSIAVGGDLNVDNNRTALDITTAGNVLTLTNNGTVSVTTESNSIDTIMINDDFGVNSSLVNNGTISATSSSRVSGALTFNGAMNGTVINNGIISAVSSVNNTYSVSISSNVGASASLENNGIIRASSVDGYAHGICFDNNVYGSIKNNEGAIISANSVNGRAFGIIAFDYMYPGSTIENAGTIIATVNNALDANAYSIVSDIGSTGMVTNTSTGKLYGNLYLDNLMNSGFVSLPYNATGLDDASIEYFTNKSTGILEIGLKTDATGVVTDNYSNLYSGIATFESGSTIGVNILTPVQERYLLAGETLTDVVYVEGSLDVNGTLNTTSNVALLGVESVVNADSIDLYIVDRTITESATAGGGSTSIKNAAAILDNMKTNGSASVKNVLRGFYAFSTDEEVKQAVESTTPVSALGAAGAALQISNGIQGIVENRQRSNFGGGLNSGEEVFGDKNLWIKAYGSFGKQDDKDGISGFNIKSRGLGFGVDGEYASNQKIGLALFYTKANVDVHNVSQSSDLGVFSTLIYGNIPFFDDKTNLLYQLGYAWQKTDSSRTIALSGDTAKANYTTNTASVDLKVIRDYVVDSKLLLQPMVEATYRNFSSPDYTETGAGALNLKTDRFSSDEFIIGLGAMANYKLDNVSKILANVNVGYDTNNERQTVTSAYEGASGIKFDTVGIDNGRWNYDVGVGYEREVTLGSSINLSYNYQREGSTFKNNVFSAKYVFSF